MVRRLSDGGFFIVGIEHWILRLITEVINSLVSLVSSSLILF
jgi:hypothetical protein